MTETKKSPKPSFADFKRTDPDSGKDAVARETFKGMDPEAAAQRAIAVCKKRQDFAKQSLGLKEGIVRRVLQTLAERKLDLSSVEAEDMADYRAYLAHLVESGELSKNYAALIANQWNATVRLMFGKEAAAPLTIRGFRQRPSKYEPIEGDEWEKVRQAILGAPTQAGSKGWGNWVFNNEFERRRFYAYWELTRTTGCRYGTAIHVRPEDIDFERNRVFFRHMKVRDREDGFSYIDARAARVLRDWIQALPNFPFWTDGSSIFSGPNGKPITNQGVNKMFKAIAVRAGITKPLTSHKVRGAVLTRVSLELDPKVAARHGHITEKILMGHYYRPTERDYESKMHGLYGDQPEPKNPLEPFLRPKPLRDEPEIQ